MDEAAKERRRADIMFTSNEALRAELMIRDSIISQLQQTIAIKDAAIDDAQLQRDQRGINHARLKKALEARYRARTGRDGFT